ncbi:carbohydrate ABC transporter permease [Allonocardiopsis opalescens]|uniref:Multiple sugar transport system permease protein n=1 Tax=Allonocardiopsis opalescens TaxID=1144618 RepID=A0A2T0QAH2_9ACTN|nr:sugar ABC transporter permease [Allonocardiopsis opalescens]PRY00810.1 multiple sugar transport system permease protein [Allonocardiopsis opalescens]
MSASAAPTRDAPPPAKRRRRRQVAPYVFAAAAALYLLAFTATPLFRGVDMSFTDTRLLNPTGGRYIGFDNYVSVLGGAAFWNSVATTLVYTGATVACSLVFGTAAAVLINRAFPGRTFARAVMTLPWAVPTVAVVLVFRWIYNDGTGVANQVTGALGLGQPNWLIDPRYGMLAVLIATVWKVTPFVMLVVLAALQSVPDELYEATRVDGADGLSTFKAVVLPYLMPTLRVVALLMTIWSFRRFEIIFLLTGGGADTNTIVVHVYREAFLNSDLGTAAAIGMLGLVLSLIVTVVYFVMERRAMLQEGDR